MKIEFYHASKFGNGAMVAEEFKKIMAGKGVTVNLHHIRVGSPKAIPSAELYVFSSPGRMGKPIKGMRKFLKKLHVPPGSRYAVLVTELNPDPQPDEKTGKTLTEEKLGRCQQVIPIMNSMLQAKGMKKVTDGRIYVTGIKGPLEVGWQAKVDAFATAITKAIASSSSINQYEKKPTLKIG